MKGPLTGNGIETVWYENDDPVKEYLDHDNIKRTDNRDQNKKPEKLSWLDIIEKSAPAK